MRRIGDDFLRKRPPPSRWGQVTLAGLVVVLGAAVTLFAIGRWEAGVYATLALGALFLVARRMLLP